MILNCTECRMRYLVDDASLGATGRNVRCVNCGYTWLQYPEGFEPPPPVAPKPKPVVVEEEWSSISPAEHASEYHSLASHSSVPEVFHHQPPRYIRYLCIALITTFVILWPINNRKTIVSYPMFATIFEPLGIYATEGLVLADLHADKSTIDETRVRITVSCNIKNEAKEEKMLPYVRVLLLNNKGRQIVSSPDMIATGQTISANALWPCIPFVYDATDGEIDRIQADIADAYDLALRKD